MHLTSTAKVFNLSLTKEFKFSLQLNNYLSKCMYLSGLSLSQELFIEMRPSSQIEQLPEFEKYHSSEIKQRLLNYNPRNPIYSADINLKYNDFEEKYTYALCERINLFFQDVLSRIMGLLQNRRIIIEILKIQNSKQQLFAMPLFMRASFIDSVACGVPLVSVDNLEHAIHKALLIYFNTEKDKQIYLIGLLKRYNDLLNLPYSYERAEAIWKIIESLSTSPLISNPDEQLLTSEYKRMLPILGIKHNSKNLESFLKTLIAFNISYQDNDIQNTWNFRNENTHEFLNLNSLYQIQDTAYNFLIRTLQKILTNLFNINDLYVDPGSLCIDGRVL